MVLDVTQTRPATRVDVTYNGLQVELAKTGRPFKGTSVSEHLRALLVATPETVLPPVEELSGAARLARVAFAQAEAGDPRFFELILDRTEGKVTIPVANVTPVTLLIPEADDVP